MNNYKESLDSFFAAVQWSEAAQQQVDKVRIKQI